MEYVPVIYKVESEPGDTCAIGNPGPAPEASEGPSNLAALSTLRDSIKHKMISLVI